MMQPKRYEPYRIPNRNERQRQKDPYVRLLYGQILLVVLLLLVAYTARYLEPEAYAQVRGEYDRLLLSDHFVPSGTQEHLEAVAAGYAALRDQAEARAQGWIDGLFTPREPDFEADQAPDVITVPPEVTGVQSEEATVQADLTGAGGWMGKGGQPEQEAPQGCVTEQLTLQTTLEPPLSGVVTSFYGWREHPVSGEADFHRGMDIAAAQGKGIYTPLAGRVTAIDESSIYGLYITVDHGGGLVTTYCHCSEICAQLGDNLRAGELVARVGSTGISTGPHVHMEVSVQGTYYNPAWVVRGMNGRGV